MQNKDSSLEDKFETLALNFRRNVKYVLSDFQREDSDYFYNSVFEENNTNENESEEEDIWTSSDEISRRTLTLRRVFSKWRASAEKSKVLRKRAIAYRELKLKSKFFRRWKEETCASSLQDAKNERLAEEHYNMSLMRFSFTFWRWMTILRRKGMRIKQMRDQKPDCTKLIKDFFDRLKKIPIKVDLEPLPPRPFKRNVRLPPPVKELPKRPKPRPFKPSSANRLKDIRSQMKQIDNEISRMRLMSDQLKNQRAVTDLELYKELSKKPFDPSEDDPKKPKKKKKVVFNQDSLKAKAGKENKLKDEAASENPEFLQRSNMRRKERTERRSQLSELKEKRLQEKKDKTMKAFKEEQALRAERRKKRLEEEKLQEYLKKVKAEEKEKMKVKIQMADSFNRKRLLRHYALTPWKRMMADMRLDLFLAEKTAYYRLTKKYLEIWRNSTRESMATKAEDLKKADEN